jgi:hypothetical protein
MQSTIAKYNNGGFSVTLAADGTKTRTKTADNASPTHPESIDVKITDYCDMGCAYCHESSTEMGKHADLDRLIRIFDAANLPPGVEMAIGGGNPLSHPRLLQFLRDLHDRGLVANLTVNQGHLSRYSHILRRIIRDDLVKGVGVSVTSMNFESIRDLATMTGSLVYHVIAGVNSPTIVQDLTSFHEANILILGYKEFGFGTGYYSPKVQSCLNLWKAELPSLLGRFGLSFDNLAIEQLAVERLLTRDAWNRLYMGDDFQFTMYIDAVKQQYAPTSRSSDRVSFADCGLLGYFTRSSPPAKNRRSIEDAMADVGVPTSLG